MRARTIVAFAKVAAQEWSDATGCEPCVSLAKEAQLWLTKVATLEDDSQDYAPVTPRAILDARE